MSSESARRSDSLIVRYRKLNGEVGGAVLSELYWQPGRTNLPREERYWPGRRNQGEHLVFTYDDEWIVFRDDQGDEEPDAVDSARNRELSEREAVVWLEDNDHFLPSVLRGRSLAGQVGRGRRVTPPMSERRQSPLGPNRKGQSHREGPRGFGRLMSKSAVRSRPLDNGSPPPNCSLRWLRSIQASPIRRSKNDCR